MTKSQVAALFAAGVVTGAGGKQAVDLLSPGPAIAAPSRPVAHAVDLRRQPDGSRLQFSAYGSRLRPDAGYVDVGMARRCQLDDKQERALQECMGIASAACEW